MRGALVGGGTRRTRDVLDHVNLQYRFSLFITMSYRLDDHVRSAHHESRPLIVVSRWTDAVTRMDASPAGRPSSSTSELLLSAESALDWKGVFSRKSKLSTALLMNGAKFESLTRASCYNGLHDGPWQTTQRAKIWMGLIR